MGKAKQYLAQKAHTQKVHNRSAFKLWGALDSLVDGLTQEIIRAEGVDSVQKKWRSNQKSISKNTAKNQRANLTAPEEDVKFLMTSASKLSDVWHFLTTRLGHGTRPDLLCFSVIDDSEEFVRVKFLTPHHPQKPFDEPIIPLSEQNNHLIYSYKRKDTTFATHIQEFGDVLLPYLPGNLGNAGQLNIFSVPFIAGNQTIAMCTMGFSSIDAFSQAKLSYVYTLRDQIAHVVWNLILQERMANQAQVDNLTGLLCHSSFQQVLEQELTRAETNRTSTTLMILDINNIHEINQNHGHDVGDEAICHLASSVRRYIRGLDTVGRYGGDDIAVILPETDEQSADEIAQRFIQAIQDSPPPRLESWSISIGYATYSASATVQSTQKEAMQKTDIANIAKHAEQALQLAKFQSEQECQQEGQTVASAKMACHEMGNFNDKVVLEAFAAQIAKKYNTHGTSVFKELVDRIEDTEEGLIKRHDSHQGYHYERQSELLMFETIGSLAGALDAKDKYTRGHSQAVANYAIALCHALNLPASMVEQVRLAAFLHDIGKIGIPESILSKPGPLTPEEWAIMNQHPVIGARQILAPVSALKDIIPLVEHHHERWDGTGHPAGLKGQDIPLGARIVSIVDAFHALTSDRSYRAAMTVVEAQVILDEGAGKIWDPNLIEIFFEILSDASPRGVGQATASAA